jgi:CheY-like chemotaxis protein
MHQGIELTRLNERRLILGDIAHVLSGAHSCSVFHVSLRDAALPTFRGFPMIKRGSRVTLHVSRPARIVLQDVRARLNTLECVLANLSTTGALLRTRAAVAVDREIPLIIELAPKPAILQVRVVRCEPADVALPGAVWRRQQEYALGVMFLKPSGEALQAIRQLTVSGIEKSSPRVLVLGEEDEVSNLIDVTLTEADYITRLLTHPGYTIATAKRIGAKAVVVNLRIDPEFSARSILDALRADPATAGLPVIVCARQAWLQPLVRNYFSQQRLRLLLVPFTPEELVMTLDRAILEGR